jgi:hypothetical protein
MLLHIDGRKHRWLNEERWYDRIVILDDATSEIYYAPLVEEESTRTGRAAWQEGIETQGLFCALYSDRGSPFFLTPKAGEKGDKHRLTQVGRARKELSMQMIPAYSPQARGRSERNFGTWQGRLPQELRLAQVTTREEANAFLRERYIGHCNAQCSVPATEQGTAFRKCSRQDLDQIFSLQTERVVAKDNTVAIGERCWQLEKARFRPTLAGSLVTIHEHLDDTISLRFGPHLVGRFAPNGTAWGENKERGGKDGVRKNQTAVSPNPLEISPTARNSHFPTAPTATVQTTKKGKPKAA